MTEPVLEVERSGGIAILTLNRPAQLNALSRELRAAIAASLSQLEADKSVGVVILTGAGRAFCAGLDLKELGGESPTRGDPTGAIADADIVRAMHRFDRPTIGAINGVAVTGGFELALACDVLIASTEARFADTHARVGILPGWGLSQKLPRLIGIHRAKELAFTGNYLGASQAEAWGLVNRVVPPEELLPTCLALARDMLTCDPLTLREYKRVIDEGFARSFGEGLKLEEEASRAHARQLSPEMIAARRASLQQRGRSQSGT
ncbi:MAG TPA: enoyl-CoA hydratase [Myxococcota bacterium]|nr:enoyl-CoA hydratase [Myxococcota bacterium]